MSDVRDKIINFFEKEISSYKDNTLKTKEKTNQKKNQKKTNFLNILKMNQKVLTMICLKIILVL